MPTVAQNTSLNASSHTPLIPVDLLFGVSSLKNYLKLLPSVKYGQRISVNQVITRPFEILKLHWVKNNVFIRGRMHFQIYHYIIIIVPF